ncbi:tetratricopeptide repeat protein [Spirulina sp. CS-785/01]|uniref:CHAT domain-containing protein n=1 Tax=Spirulina sp. CS-785/01 TaxID=3021716 RepID=UPI00232AD9FC|nr:CHAT domain-containing protein [Spirulina sp. CS-785/01]MDB9311630.1 tetratricopeptide repeat protein [Spirulina sp. CS-785/01]
MLQWFKNLSQQLNPQNNMNPVTTDTETESVESGDEEQQLTDKDREFLFNQLLEGIAHGWQPLRVERFFEALEHRGSKEQWVEWLQRYGAKLLAASNPDEELAKQMIALGEVTRSSVALQKVGDTASGIGRLLLAKVKKEDSDTWEYEPPPTPAYPPVESENDSPASFTEMSRAETRETEMPVAGESPSSQADPLNLGGEGAKTITLDELLVRLQQDENLVQQVAKRLGLDTTDPQEIIQELVRQINQKGEGTSQKPSVSPTPPPAAATPPSPASPQPIGSPSPATATPENATAEVAFNRGVKAYEEGNFEGAIAAWQEATEIKPDYYQAWGNLGLGLKNLGRYEEALESYNRAIEIKPDFHKAWYNKGLALDELKRYDEALAAYTKVIEIKPDFHKAWYSRGNSLESLGQSEEAIACYDRAVELRSDFYKAWYSRGNSLKNMGRYQEAVTSYDGALRLKGDDGDSWFHRGVALASLGQPQEAIASYNKALEVKPNDLQILWQRGNALAAVGEYGQALADYDLTLDLQSDFLPVWSSRGQVLAALGRIPEGLAAFDRALAMNEADSHLWQQRGHLLAKAHRYPEALESYDRALTLNPDRPTYWNSRGAVLLKLGRSEEAIACYDRSLQLQAQRWQTWKDRAEAVQQSPKADLLLTALSPMAQNNPHLNERGYGGKLATLKQGLEYFPRQLHPEGWGRLQHHIGFTQFQAGEDQEESASLWREALQAYEAAKTALTPDRFPLAHLYVLRDQFLTLLGLEETQKAKQLQETATAQLETLLATLSSPTQQQKTVFELAGLYHLQVDLAIQEGERVKALEKAEQSKNIILSWLLDQPQLRDTSCQWTDIQTLLTPQTALVYWHLSPATLTTFVVKPGQTEPLIIGYTPNVVLNVVLNPSLRSRIEQAKQNSEASLAILLELLGLEEDQTTSNSEPPPSPGEQPITQVSENNGDEYKQARQRRQQFWQWWHNWQKTAAFPEQLTQQLQELRTILQIDQILQEIDSEDIQQVILVPHSSLHELPLHLFFPDSLTLSYLPSVQLGLLSQSPSPTPPSQPEAVLPDPWLKTDVPAATNWQPQPTPPPSQLDLLTVAAPDSQDWNGQPLKEFPNASLEATMIAAYFSWAQQFGGDSLHRSQSPAAKAEVLAALQNRPRLCHFLTHTFKNRQFPRQSALALSGQERLLGQELAALPCSQMELVSFAAADTVVTPESAATVTDEAGLAVYLYSQGVSYVLKSLWTVESGARPLFMIEFYRRLSQGSPVTVAYQQAQLWLKTVTYGELVQWYFDRAKELEGTLSGLAEEFTDAAGRIQDDPAKFQATDPPYAHPYHWAAFVVLGR